MKTVPGLGIIQLNSVPQPALGQTHPKRKTSHVIQEWIRDVKIIAFASQTKKAKKMVRQTGKSL